MRHKHGFTLIELLVVISIISLLASIVMAGLQTTRAKARDSKRVQDLIQLRNALELYRADFGTYPDIKPTIGFCNAAGNPRINLWDAYSPASGCETVGDNPLDELTGNNPQGTIYLASIPMDPGGILFIAIPAVSQHQL